MKSGLEVANEKGLTAQRGDLFTLPSEEFDLKKHENIQIYFSLCFGDIQYPLSDEKK